MSSQIALGPKAQSATNMPAMDTPMKMWAMSTSQPGVLRIANGHGQQHEAVGGHGQHRHGEEVVQPRRGGRHGTRASFDPAVELDGTPFAVFRAIVNGQ